MTIWEYIAQPKHPWFNTELYTPLQIGMFTVGALLWVVVYLVTIQRLIKSKDLDIPAYAVTLNFGCEITTAIFFVPDMGLALVIAYWLWMLLDIFIVIGMFLYASKQTVIPYVQKNLRLFLVVLLPVTFVIQYNFILQFDLPMAPIDSYLINLVMSVCFVYLAFVPKDVPNSKIVAWCKFLGTGVISIMFFTKYPSKHLLTAAYIGCAFFDIVYIYILHNEDKLKSHGQQANV